MNVFLKGTPLHTWVNRVHFKGAHLDPMKHTWWNWHAGVLEPRTAYWNITSMTCKTYKYEYSYMNISHSWDSVILPNISTITRYFSVVQEMGFLVFLFFYDINAILTAYMDWVFFSGTWCMSLVWNYKNFWDKIWISFGSCTLFSQVVWGKFVVIYYWTVILIFWNHDYFHLFEVCIWIFKFCTGY